MELADDLSRNPLWDKITNQNFCRLLLLRSLERTHLSKSDLHIFCHVNLAVVVKVWAKCANAHLLHAIEMLEFKLKFSHFYARFNNCTGECITAVIHSPMTMLANQKVQQKEKKYIKG